MSRIDFHALERTRDMIREMANEGVFTPVDSDSLKRLKPTSVIMRVGQRDRESDDGRQFGGERSIELPGIVISHAGHHRPESGGEQDWDTGVITQYVELIDNTTSSDDENLKTYFTWMDAIREHLQDADVYNPPIEIGDIYFVHVTDVGAPDQNNWIYHRQVRSSLRVVLYTKTRRDIKVTP